MSKVKRRRKFILAKTGEGRMPAEPQSQLLSLQTELSLTSLGLVKLSQDLFPDK